MLELHGARENIRLLETEQKLHDEAIKKLTAQMEAAGHTHEKSNWVW